MCSKRPPSRATKLSGSSFALGAAWRSMSPTKVAGVALFCISFCPDSAGALFLHKAGERSVKFVFGMQARHGCKHNVRSKLC